MKVFRSTTVAADSADSVAPVKPRGRREEKAEASCRALIDATIAIVNRSGYAGATIARITKKARLAHGTFYNYFKNRQELLDLMPPTYGERLLEYIASRMRPELSGVEREMARLDAFVEFFVRFHWSGRLIGEAPAMAPTGYERYDRMVLDGYVRALRRSAARGEIAGYTDTELESLARMLLFVRAGLAQTYLSGNSPDRRLPPRVLNAYRKLVTRAFGKMTA
jgi:AcrR family transcriptional regulator